MTHIGDSLDLFGDIVASGVPEEHTEIVIDRGAIDKALFTLRQLKAAALKMPFDFDMDESALMWAPQVAQFSNGIINDAIAEWIATESECPSVGEFASICQQIVVENIRLSAAADAKARNPEGKWCEECGIQDEVHPDHGLIRGFNLKYVRVEDPDTTIISPKGVPILVTGNHHRRPCSLCLPDSYELYMANHFTAEHRTRGGCVECQDYMPGHSAKKKKAKVGS